ncbi:cysteine desulfurase family protein [Nocardioides okcheonensis]|uniref:cysteine desulfurase family protein n=1 Tax=Nocardioides okcheonensis TaxID=2894081 RepID=UPI001E505A62|nr:cysteine desulfurase family protein [Nocardioides okcheonensis]UFN46443.1 cysteine desulfurase [Nocardioides okcheonensis]
MSELVYLDYNATTPLAPEALDAMLPWMAEKPWNAASAHLGGRMASRAVETARGQVADLIGARDREIVFTSGSTEANNLAIKGSVLSHAGRRRILIAATEHKAVLETADALAVAGFKAELLPVGRDGLLDLDHYKDALADDVSLVSVMLANNETGVIQPIGEIAELAHRVGALVHTDATQAPGRIEVDVETLSVDLASISGHKFYGPKGVGALYVRRGVDLAPQQVGGGHEGGLRSGTINVPGVVGLGVASALAKDNLVEDADRSRSLIDVFLGHLERAIPGWEVTTGTARRLPNTINLRFAGADGEAVMVNAPSILMSTGSACTSRVPDASHVLQAMGLTQEEAYQCLRFSVGRGTTPHEMSVAAGCVASAVERVRALS